MTNKERRYHCGPLSLAAAAGLVPAPAEGRTTAPALGDEAAAPPPRQAEQSKSVKGYAALFNSRSENLGYGDFEFYEVISPGAFDQVAYAGVVALFNHDQNLPLARYGAGLALGVDTRGLWYEFALPDTTLGRDLHELLTRGIISQSSFAFTVDDFGQEWSEVRDKDGKTTTTRTINKISALYDVSLVTRPAYADTTVAVRSLQASRAARGQLQLPLSATAYALTGLPLPPFPSPPSLSS